jgi:hypothetical protein
LHKLVGQAEFYQGTEFLSIFMIYIVGCSIMSGLRFFGAQVLQPDAEFLKVSVASCGSARMYTLYTVAVTVID